MTAPASVDDDLLARARNLVRSRGSVPPKSVLQKELGVGWPRASEAHAQLTVEAEQDRAERKAQHRSRLSKLRSRKAPAGRLPARPGPPPMSPLPPTINPAEPSAGAVAQETPGEPIVEAVEVFPGSPEPVRTVRPGALAAFAVTASLAAAGGTYLGSYGWPSNIHPLLAVVGAAVTLVVLTWSGASILRALVAGRTGRDVALDFASWTVAGVAGFLAAYGQVKFAQWAGVTGSMRFLVPGILEPSVVVLLLLANRRVKRRGAGHRAKPIGKLLALAALLGGFAVYTNVVHAGGRTGLVFGAATVVGLILWWVKLQDDAAPDDWDDEPQSRRLSRKTSKYRLLRWLILFQQTRRAWLISLDHSVSDAEAGLDLARRWRRAYDVSREAGNGRRVARRQAAAHIDEWMATR